MSNLLQIVSVNLLAAGLLLWVGVGVGYGGLGLSAGSATSDAAAALDLGGDSGFSYAGSDTTEYEFPDEIEEKKTNFQVAKDIAIYTVAAGFIAFFIIEVFLKGDTDDPPPEPIGKPLPTARSIDQF